MIGQLALTLRRSGQEVRDEARQIVESELVAMGQLDRFDHLFA